MKWIKGINKKSYNDIYNNYLTSEELDVLTSDTVFRENTEQNSEEYSKREKSYSKIECVLLEMVNEQKENKYIYESENISSLLKEHISANKNIVGEDEKFYNTLQKEKSIQENIIKEDYSVCLNSNKIKNDLNNIETKNYSDEIEQLENEIYILEKTLVKMNKDIVNNYISREVYNNQVKQQTEYIVSNYIEKEKYEKEINIYKSQVEELLKANKQYKEAYEKLYTKLKITETKNNKYIQALEEKLGIGWKQSEEEVILMCKLRDEGLSNRQISKILKEEYNIEVSYGTVRNRLMEVYEWYTENIKQKVDIKK